MYTAIIVEPRKHKALSFVLNNFCENLSNDWNFIIFHGNLNIDYISDIIKGKLSNHKHRISMLNLNVDNLTIPDYNRLFINNFEFYDKIPTEIFLVFQTDTMINTQYKDLINDFLEYDYVGAPWIWTTPYGQVGNGGLSLRKKSKMLEIMKNGKNKHLNEDVYFSMSNVIKLNKPTFEKAKEFSMEMIFSEKSFGCHKSYAYINNSILFKTYPDIELLKELNM